MKGFNECINGHYYNLNLDKCPYCPNTGSGYTGNLDKTIVDDGFPNDKTVADSDFGKTVIEDTPQHENAAVADQQSSRDLSKTYIKVEDTDKEGMPQEATNRQQRKLVGWLVSYTLNELGRDYRLYEGRNTIGASVENNIIIAEDTAVSGQHAVILYRDNKFYIKDNLSTNGTQLNGKNLEPDTPEVFGDKAKIKVGDTFFTVRTSF